MATRHLYVVRHGDADTFGEITDIGYRQTRLLGQRLTAAPIDVIWHSPLPRAVASAHEIARHLSHVPVIEAPELIDHVPFVPGPSAIPSPWVGFFDGYDEAEAAAGHDIAQSLAQRFGNASTATTSRDTHEVLVTHSYPIAWLLRHAMEAPPAKWMGLNSANAALTLIEHRAGAPSSIVMFNEMSHLPPHLRWTGFPDTVRP